MSSRTMTFFIFIALTAISCPVQGSLLIADHQHTLMHFTQLISEEHFTAGRPLVIVLPLAAEDSTIKEEEYLIERLHTSGRWPLMVYNVSRKMSRNMYTEIHPHGSYIILISGPCKEWEEHISRYMQQLYKIFIVEQNRHSWNPRAKFIVSVISNCTHTENKIFSKAILNELWLKEIINVAVLFLKSNEQAGNVPQQNTTDSAQGTYLELHTWYPYENLERCNPAEGTVPVKVFTVRNVSDIRRSDIFRRKLGKNFHRCPMKVNVKFMPPLVNKPRTVWNNGSGHHNVYEDGWEIEMLRIVGEALNMSLYFADDINALLVTMYELLNKARKLKGDPFISGGEPVRLHFFFRQFR
jgi:hypothetical protein